MLTQADIEALYLGAGIFLTPKALADEVRDKQAQGHAQIMSA